MGNVLNNQKSKTETHFKNDKFKNNNRVNNNFKNKLSKMRFVAIIDFRIFFLFELFIVVDFYIEIQEETSKMDRLEMQDNFQNSKVRKSLFAGPLSDPNGVWGVYPRLGFHQYRMVP